MAQVARPYTLDSPPPKTVMISSIQAIPLYRNEVLLRNYYLEKKLSIKQISELIFSSRWAVRENLKRFGIPIRPADEAHSLRKGQVAFGKKVVKDKEVDHLRELENLAMMRKLRAKGHSYHKIAEIFETMKIPTKNKGSRWQGTTIMNILKRSAPEEEKEAM